MNKVPIEINENNIKIMKDSIKKKFKINFENLELVNLTSISDLKDLDYVFKMIGENVQHLTMRNTAAFMGLKDKVKNLKSLKIYIDDVLRVHFQKIKFSEFPYLQSLEFIHNMHWSDEDNRLLIHLIENSQKSLQLKRVKFDVKPEKNLEDMPVEMLLNIFSYLPINDLREMRLVSKSLKKLVDRQTMQKSQLIITDKNIKDIRKYILIPNIDKSIFRNLKVVNIEDMRCLHYIFTAISGQVEHLTLEDTPAYKINGFKHLKSLILLNFFYSKKIPDLHLERFPFLERLEIDPDYMLFELLQRPAKIPRLKHLRMNISAKTEQILIRVFIWASATLEHVHLDFEHFEPYDVIWPKIFKRLVNLKVLRLTGYCPQDWLKMAFENLSKITKLEHIEVSGCGPELNDTILTLIVSKWKNSLQTIHLGSSTFTDMGLIELGKLCKMRSLDISFCGNITSEGFEEITIKDNPNMKELDLSYLCSLDERCLSKMALRFPNLRVLKLQNSGKFVTNSALAQIFCYLTRLRFISIAGCHKITDKGLIGFGSTPYSIKRLRGLETLCLRDCYKLTDCIFNEALHLPELRTIIMNGCPHITIHGIQILMKNIPSLETLGIPTRVVIKTKWLIKIGEGLKRLRKIIVDVDDSSILAEEAFYKLKNGKIPMFPNCVLKFDF